MKKFSFIIIEDIELQRRFLSDLLKKRMDLRSAGEFESAEDAYEFLTHPDVPPIDLIFLDNSLPECSGADFLNSIKNFAHLPRVIVITAYPEKAFEFLNFAELIAGFVPKVIDKNRLNAVIDKAINKIKERNEAAPRILSRPSDAEANPATVFDITGKEKIRLFHTEILYFEAAGGQIKIITPERTYLTNRDRIALKNVPDLLQNPDFARVHDSFIVNFRHYHSHKTSLDTLKIRPPGQGEIHEISIGPKYRDAVKKILHAKNLLPA